MLRCPKCNRSYKDEQKFCTHDGGRLVSAEDDSTVSSAPAANLNATMIAQPKAFSPPSVPETAAPAVDLNRTVLGVSVPEPMERMGAQWPAATGTDLSMAPTSRDLPPVSPPQPVQASAPSSAPPQAAPESHLREPAARSAATFTPPMPDVYERERTLAQQNAARPTAGAATQVANVRQYTGELQPQQPVVAAEQRGNSNTAVAASEVHQSGPQSNLAHPEAHVAIVEPPAEPLRPVEASAYAAKLVATAGTGSEKKGRSLGLIFAIITLVIVLVGVASAGGLILYFKYPDAIRQRLGRRAVVNNNTDSNSGNTSTTDVNGNTGAEQSPNTNANTSVPEPAPPANAGKFINSRTTLDGDLAKHYADFSFYYPNSWVRDATAGVPGAVNFAQVTRKTADGLPQENFVVGWYDSHGSLEADKQEIAKSIAVFNTRFAKNVAGYQKVSEGSIEINGIKGYEFRFKGETDITGKGMVNLWGRVVFLPPTQTSATSGVTLIMYSTSLAPEITGLEDVGVKGELPVILDSFKLGQ